MSLDLHFEKRLWVSIWTRNITHNLVEMAKAAGVYEALWRPEEVGIEVARDMIELLTEGLRRLEEQPTHFRTFNPPTGWGSYETLVSFVRETLAACKENPTARVRAWR